MQSVYFHDGHLQAASVGYSHDYQSDGTQQVTWSVRGCYWWRCSCVMLVKIVEDDSHFVW